MRALWSFITGFPTFIQCRKIEIRYVVGSCPRDEIQKIETGILRRWHGTAHKIACARPTCFGDDDGFASGGGDYLLMPAMEISNGKVYPDPFPIRIIIRKLNIGIGDDSRVG